ncbi:MAG: hypothetical protein AAGG44_12960, partial [Planctomycetota bacterium]
DIGESMNLADTETETATRLHQMMKDWRDRVDAPVPTELNPRFDAEKEAAQIQKLKRAWKSKQRGGKRNQKTK